MKKRGLYVLYLFLAVLALSEILLRVTGHSPGIFQDFAGFRPTDELHVYQNFSTDDSGIYAFSSWITDSVHKYYDVKKRRVDNPAIDENCLWVDDVDYIYRSYAELQSGDDGQQTFLSQIGLKPPELFGAELPQAYKKLKAQPTLNNDWEKQLVHYVEKPFNSNGFRSIEFTDTASTRTKVLLIGDSFVYGMTAQPYYNSFSDILLARGYMVYNTGIPGTDPAQYAAIAKKYVPLLAPDVVVVNFFPGNDFMPYARYPKKNEPYEHITNAGLLNASPNGTYLNAHEAYAYYLSLASIPDTDKNLFNRFCSHSSLLSLLWGMAYQKGWVNHAGMQAYNGRLSQEWQSRSLGFTQYHLRQIAGVCQRHQVPLLFAVIPYQNEPFNQNRSTITVDTAGLNPLFLPFPYHYPSNFTHDDYYGKNDYHFNNAGALKYASFLETLIRQSLPPKNEDPAKSPVE